MTMPRLLAAFQTELQPTSLVARATDAISYALPTQLPRALVSVGKHVALGVKRGWVRITNPVRSHASELAAD